MDSFDKGWFVLQTYSGYENKVKENLLQRAQTYNMLENILRVEIPTQTVQVEKNGKTMLVTYMAVRDAAGTYLGTMELVQDMGFAKEHFLSDVKAKEAALRAGMED